MNQSSLLPIACSSVLAALAAFTGYLRGLPIADEIALDRVQSLTKQANALAIETSLLKFWLRGWSFLLIAVPAIGCCVGSGILGVVMGMLIYTVPGHVLNFLVQRRRTLLRDQMVSAVQGLANATQAGLTIYQGLVEIAGETPNPLRFELKRIVAENDHGRSLREAIESVRARLDLESFSLFAIAIQTTLERGGSISASLQRIAHSLREHQRIERKMGADTASGSREILLLCLFPWVFLLFSYWMYPAEQMVAMMQSWSGQIMLLLVVGLVYIGARWAIKIMDLEE